MARYSEDQVIKQGTDNEGTPIGYVFAPKKTQRVDHYTSQYEDAEELTQVTVYLHADGYWYTHKSVGFKEADDRFAKLRAWFKR